MLPRFAIGGALIFSVSLADYPASAGWVLSYRLVRKSGVGAVSFSAAADGDAHAVNVAAATTAAWTPGEYTWFSSATLGANVRNVDSGEIVLLPDPRTATSSLDLRSEAQIALDNVRATLRGTGDANVKFYIINGRQLQRYGIDELITLEQKLARDVRREQQAITGRNTRRMVARVARA